MSERNRKCKHCKAYKPALNGLETPVGWFCSYEHATHYSTEKVARKRKSEASEAFKKERQERQARKEAKRDKKWWLKKAQEVFNVWIRNRDKDEPCISCQRYHQGQYHAGHYRTTKAAPQLRFNESNCFKQCAPCNNHLSGNVLEYRINLIKKIGIDGVEALESNQSLKIWTIEELKMIVQSYSEVT